VNTERAKKNENKRKREAGELSNKSAPTKEGVIITL